MSKGLIRKPEKAGRVVDFAGMNRSKNMSKDSVYATDIDCAMEFSNKYLILVEIKEKGQILRNGQKWFLERMAKSWYESGLYKGTKKKAIVLFATHDPALEYVVPVSECTVTKAYMPHTNEWKEVDCGLIECLQGIGDSWGIDKLKKPQDD